MTFLALGLWGRSVRVAYVSSRGAALDAAMQRLQAAACDRIFVEPPMRGQRGSRPALASLLKQLKADDELVILSLDHLADTTAGLIALLDDLALRGVRVAADSAPIDLRDPGTATTLRLLSAFDQARRRARGETLSAADGPEPGRPRLLVESAIAQARELIEVEGRSITEVARGMGVSRATLYRSLKRSDAG